jgi:two-component system chemotaxis response regulator CheB
MKSIKVLVVDDSPSMRLMLNHMLALDERIQVLATVNDGQAAIDFLNGVSLRPDVVLMDIHMPRIDGFEATRRIMETNPLPIVICTATADPHELQVAFRSMEAGAVACVEKPVGYEDPRFETIMQNLQQTVRLMSEVKVIRRWPRPRLARVRTAAENPATHRVISPRVIGIGASTGGPPVLQSILSGLPRDFAAPLVIVQHIARGFLPGMVEWLNQTTGLHVHVAAHGVAPERGHAYIAPDDFHLGVSAAGRLVLSREPAESGLRPAVSFLFRSLADNLGANAVGVLLTGMGRDGADELKRLRDLGALTIAQDRETCVVHGMPGAAIEIGAAAQVLPADRISAALITELTRRIPQAGGVES